jgi:chorismate synthase
MRGNTFGHLLTLTTFGESHGTALGAVIDGCPTGIPLDIDDFASALQRRRPGHSAITSARAEDDVPAILSGVLEGRTLGTPICVIVRNTDARPADYRRGTMRPGHADKTWEEKYGIRDHRGGGRASGRETIGRVIGGVVAEKILPSTVRIVGFTRQIGGIAAEDLPEEMERATVDAHPTRCPDPAAAERMQQELLACKAAGDSRGGIAELRIDGVPAGLGEPVFRKAKSELASALMSIGAVIGVTLGDAPVDALLDGRSFHDEALSPREGISLRAQGIQGGITNGERITLRAFVKPTSTIGELAQRGRHDPCIVPRIIPVLEAMAALVLADLYLARRLDRAEADNR